MGEQRKVNQADTDLSRMLKVRRDRLAEPQAAGKDPFQITKYDVTAHSINIRDSYEQWEGKEATIAGRMMFKRVIGKAFLCNIQDLKSSVQVYVARDSVGEESCKNFREIDIGDIVGVEGTAFTIKTGGISVHATEVALLSKNPQVLPEEFRGLTDTDMRYHQRYVDLIMNTEVKDTFIKRSRILAAIRKYLGGEGFMKVETPMLISSASGTVARSFETHFNTLDGDLKPRISLELYLKKLIVGELERVYKIGRIFRSEGLDIRHNPEFTLMELYQAYTDYSGMMGLIEKLYRSMAQGVPDATTITHKGMETDLGKPFARITMVGAVKKYVGVDFGQIRTLEEARAVTKEKGVESEGRHKKDDILNLFFEGFAKEHLVQPIFVLNHPVEISPLTRKKPGNPDYVERFESFMNGWEMASTCSEINDPIGQGEQFRAQEGLLVQGDEEISHTDEDFLNALKVSMPPTGGIGFGTDRIVMLLMDSPAIRDVLLFLTMRSLGGSGDSKKADMASVRTAAEAGNTAEKVQIIQERIDFSKVRIKPLFEEMVDFDTFAKSDYRAVKIKDCVAVPKSEKLLQFTLGDGSGTGRTILSGIREYYEPEELIGKTTIAIVNLPSHKMMRINSYGMLVSAVHEEDGKEELNLLMVDGQIPVGAKPYQNTVGWQTFVVW